ncbi:MAG: hypothetical protein ACRC2V_10785 [Xenococcaceae cyanobacterium]
MSKFYGNMAFVGCGNGCNSKLQKVALDENGQPVDMDWDGLQEIYSNHNANCSAENPFTGDSNAFYGNPDDCAGFVVAGDPNSGHKYCEF